MKNIKEIDTEKMNPNTKEIDSCTTEEMLFLINQEDAKVPKVVHKAIPQIALAVDAAHRSIKQGGHLIYLGAGTSGRLGVLDASECVPTYGVKPDLVRGYIAGGDKALRIPVEGCEDSSEQGEQLIIDAEVTDKDVVIGISASGTAAFVISALTKAKEIGATTVAIVNNYNTPLKDQVDICIEAVTGAEAIGGSTRMKAGTSQKLILNMISTCTMIKLGRVYKNWMVDLKASNKKLHSRAKRIFCDVTGENEMEAELYLKAADYDTKLAILMCISKQDKESAEQYLESSDGFLRDALIKAGCNL